MAGFQFDLDRSGRTGLETVHVDAGHSTIIAMGDHVALTGTAHTDGTREVDSATAGGLFVGVVVGTVVDYANETLNEQGLPALTAGSLIINTSPEAIYEVDGDGSVALTADEVGLNFDSIVTAATRSGGVTRSNFTLDTTTTGVTTTAQWRVMGIVDGDFTTAQRIKVMPVSIGAKIETGV